MKFAFRVDASSEIGTGHLVRCLSFAQAIREKNHQVYFLMRRLPGHLSDMVSKRGFEVCILEWPDDRPYAGRDHASWLGVSWQQDAVECAAVLKSIKPDWLIVDHYALDSRWEEQIRATVAHLMIIDDLADRPHACDILLDQNLVQNSRSRYQNLIPAACTPLLGPSYALMRAEFSRLRSKGITVRRAPIRGIAISFGGVDLPDATSLTLNALKIWNGPALDIDVIVGAGSPHLINVEKICRTMPNAQLHCQPENMADLFLRADVGIGASGSTTWERSSLGLPSILIALAKNQEVVGEGCRHEQVAAYLGPIEKVRIEDICASLEQLNRGDQLSEFSRKCSELVDGQGAQRATEALSVP